MSGKFGRAVSLLGRIARSVSNTMWPGPRPTSVPSGILIHPTVWPQYTNVTGRQTGQIGQTTVRSYSIRRTVLQTVTPKNRRIWGVGGAWLCRWIVEGGDKPSAWSTVERSCSSRFGALSFRRTLCRGRCRGVHYRSGRHSCVAIWTQPNHDNILGFIDRACA